jgi:hypothetical protein
MEEVILTKMLNNRTIHTLAVQYLVTGPDL